MNHTSLIRPLGSIESRMAVMHELAGNTQTTSVVDLDVMLDQARLKIAVDLWLQTFEILSSRLVTTKSSFELHKTDLEAESILSKITLSDNYDLSHATTVCLNSLLLANKALVAVVLLEDAKKQCSHIALTFHHSIVDGLSIATLVESLLGYYQTGVNSLARNKQTVAPALEQFLSLQEKGVAEKKLLKTVTNETSIASKETPDDLPVELIVPQWKVEESVEISRRSSAYLETCFDHQTMLQLKIVSKELNSTLNTLLTYAFCRAIAELQQRNSISCLTAVSLRNRVQAGINDDVIGCYIKVLPHTVSVSTSLNLFIDSYQQKLSRSAQQLTSVQDDISLVLLRQRAKSLQRIKAFSHDVAMTNHGQLNLMQDYEKFSIIGYRNLANRNGGNFAIALHIASLDHQMSCAFTYSIPLLNTQTAEKIQVLFEQNIKRILLKKHGVKYEKAI